MPHFVSRRNFLAAGAVLTAGVASNFDGFATLVGGPRLWADDSTQRFGRWPIGIQSYTLRKFNAMEAIRHMQALGLHNVEFYPGHLPINASDEQLQEMRDVLAKARLKITAHGVNGFSKNHDANRRIFEFAKKMEIRNITANPQPDSFDSLDKLCEEFDIRIAIHNHGPGALYDKLPSVVEAVKDRHPHVGVCIDTGHTLRSNEDPVEWARTLGPRVFALHIKDVAEKQARTHDVVIGTAHLKLVELFEALRDIKFPADGSISLEYESNPDNPIDDVRECLAAAEAAIAKVG